MISVDDRETIRRAYFVDHCSIRYIARTFHFSRKTIVKAIAAAEPARYTLTTPRAAPKLGPFRDRIQALLAENEHLPKKQRYTSRRIFQLLHADGYSGSESHIRAYIGQLRRDTKRPKVFLPLEFDPATDAQVDWGEAEAIIAGMQRTIHLFVMRLCYSRRIFVMAFPFEKQECFFAGHVAAFAHFGGVPHRLSYDNLTTAVKRVLTGRNRLEQQAFIVFRSHYLFESHFCTPGEGHEKGGVEHGVGFARRNFLVPLPVAESFADLNAQLLAACVRDDQRRVDRQPVTIGSAWAVEQPLLHPLPERPFDCCTIVPARLNPYGQVVFETNRYSVPVDRAVRDLVLKAYPFELEILHQHETITQHERCFDREQDVIDPLHYLPLLEQRPGAFAHALPIRRWRHRWPASYDRLLATVQQRWPDGRGIREFVRILALHKTHAADHVEQAVELALEFGGCDAASVQLCLRQIETAPQVPPVLDLSARPHLAAIGTQALDLTCYDQLLERA